MSNNELELDCALAYLNEGKVVYPIDMMYEHITREINDFDRLVCNESVINEMKVIPEWQVNLKKKVKALWEKFVKFIESVVASIKKFVATIAGKVKSLFVNSNKAKAKEADKNTDNVNIDLTGKSEEVEESVVFEASEGINITVSDFGSCVICKNESDGKFYIMDDSGLNRVNSILSAAVNHIKNDKDFDDSCDITRIKFTNNVDGFDSDGKSLQTYHSFEDAMDALTKSAGRAQDAIQKIAGYVVELEQIKNDGKKEMQELEYMKADSYENEIKEKVNSIKNRIERCTKLTNTLQKLMKSVANIEKAISKQYFKLLKHVYKINGEKFTFAKKKDELFDFSYKVATASMNGSED